MSADKRRLIYSIVQFLNSELSSDDISEDAKESLEVASQCLQTAYCMAPEDTHLEVSQPLNQLFHSATQNEPMKKKAPPTVAEKEEAEKLKLEGNELMRAEDFPGAIEKYTKAIEIDSGNQVFYCNRAAAHSKMNNHYAAVEDCKRAIDMDPAYGKAYGRMGLAYACVDKHKEAIDCFKKAIELEPDNESYKSNMKLAQDKLSAAGGISPGPQPMGFPGQSPLGNMDLSGLLGNPALMNMATTMLSDPNMQNMMGQLMGGGGMGGPGGPAAGGAGGPGNLDNLLQAGQRLAEQMQSQNPELVEQLRRQMGPGDNNDPPPPPSSN